MKNDRQLLVLGNEATHSGAPIMLLRILRCLKEADWTFEIIFDRGGPLEKSFGELGRVRVLSHRFSQNLGLGGRAFRRLLDEPVLKPIRLRRWFREWSRSGGRIIYSNTAANGRLLTLLPDGADNVVSHVHELEYAIRNFNMPEDLNSVLSRTRRYFAVSSAVEEDLQKLGVEQEAIRRISNFAMELPGLPKLSIARRDLAKRLGLSADTRFVVGCGSIDQIKGTDLFCKTARLVRAKLGGQVAFVWIGRDSDLQYSVDVRTKFGGEIVFVGEVDDPSIYFAGSEVVLVTSRVESFSLVALEAGGLGRPVVAFRSSRGISDLLEDRCLVDETSPASMAALVLEYLKNPDLASECGASLRNRIADRFLAKHWVPKLVSALNEMEPFEQ